MQLYYLYPNFKSVIGPNRKPQKLTVETKNPQLEGIRITIRPRNAREDFEGL